jgi:hypothetical protein
MPRILLLLMTVLLLLAAASGASAQSSDLQADSSSVSPAIAYQPYSITVYMKNNGPDIYTGGTTRITVDIDEPTKPGVANAPGNGAVCHEGRVVIFPTPAVPVGGQVSFTYQQSFGPCGLALVRVRSTVEVQGGFTDPNPSNDTVVNDHPFAIPLPMHDWRLLMVLVVLLASSGLWLLRQRRALAHR